MISIGGIKLAPGHKPEALKARAARALGVRPGDILEMRILRRSLDARRKADIHFVYTLALDLGRGEERVLARNPAAKVYVPFSYTIPRAVSEKRPVVVGFGPAGMFAALVLAEAGLRPIVLERGGDIDSRRAVVEKFWQGGELDPECNVQFGEGGAGAFSDGKLTTGTHDPRLAFVLQSLHRFGAPEAVTYDAKPHVGTDVLRGVVKNLREHILSLGAQVLFNTRFAGFESENGALTAALAVSPSGPLRLDCSQLIFAPGHSARDSFEALHSLGLPMEPKGFSMGVRIEHLQAEVDRCQYGEAAGRLPAADYKLNCVTSGGSAYTFCMCPGGYVVAAASERCGVVTNGMSYSGRSGGNANSALLVTLEPRDFPGSGPLAGMYWQREIEQNCFRQGGGDYRAPAQRVGDFLAKKPSAGPGRVKPSYQPGVSWGELRSALPEKLCSVLAEAIPQMAKRLEFFAEPDAVLTAPETRSSSPVRILRDGSLCSPALAGFYPCGEGAGYAGGISSAAVDGIRCAEKVLEQCALTPMAPTEA